MIGDACRVACLRCADGGGGLEAVHLGHLHVHQHQVERLLLQGGQRLLAVVGHDHRVAVLLQQADGQPLVDGVVLRQQDVGAAAVGGAGLAPARSRLPARSVSARGRRPRRVTIASSSSDCLTGLVR